MPEYDESLYSAMRRLERAGFYANAKTDPVVAAAEEVLKQPLIEAAAAPVDSKMFREKFFELKSAITPLRENLTRDIDRLKRVTGSIPHVAPVEIAKRKQWINKLEEIEKILDSMMGQ